MTKEEKQLLLKDLCAREPYHPRIQVFNQGYEGFQDGEFDTDLWLHHIDAFRFARIEVLPYLRPMSSMTEEEEKELAALYVESMNVENISSTCMCAQFYYKHHIDGMGLISKGLALEAPEGMYKTE